MSHYHVSSGLYGYGPDMDDDTPTLATLSEALEYAREELSTWIDYAYESARAEASLKDYEAAWNETVRAEGLEVLRANLDPARRTAPLYVADPAAYAALQTEQADAFPHEVSRTHRLYLWTCDESACTEDDDSTLIDTESVSVTFWTLPADRVPATVDLDRIGEDVVQAAYIAAHEALTRAEGFPRFGDAMPSEVQQIHDFAKVLVRACLANGRMDRLPMHDYIVTHSFTGETLYRTRAVSPLEALSNYSDHEGFARPDRLTWADTDGLSLSDFLGYEADEDGRSAHITFTNFDVTATQVGEGENVDA